MISVKFQGHKVDWMENVHRYTFSKSCTWFKKQQQLCLQNLHVSQAKWCLHLSALRKSWCDFVFCALGLLISFIKWLALVWCHSVCCYRSWSQFLLRQLPSLLKPQLPTTEIGLSVPGTELKMPNGLSHLPNAPAQKRFYILCTYMSYVSLLPLTYR